MVSASACNGLHRMLRRRIMSGHSVTPGPRLVLPQSVRAAIEAESKSKLPNESGGILVGTLGSEEVVVHAVVGPGPRAKHGRNSFERDGEYTQAELDSLATASGGAWDYVAEWHSHTALAGPSPRDVRSMEVISRLPGYDSPEPILLICCHTKRSEWHLMAYQLRQEGLVPVLIAFATTDEPVDEPADGGKPPQD